MSFITIDKLNGSSGETISTITVPEYQGLEDRTQSFKVVVDGKEVFVNVQQKAFKPSLTTNKQVVPFTQEVLTQSLQITSNFNWEARTDSSWFTLNQTEGNKGTTTIEISTSSIDSPSENRNGIINFYFGDTFVTAITVKQEFEVIFEVEDSIDIIIDSSLNIVSNVDWYAETVDTWYSFNPSSGSSGETIMEFTPDNYGIETVIGSMSFYYNGELLKTITVGKNLMEQFYIEAIEETTVGFNTYIEFYNENFNYWDSTGANRKHILQPNEKRYYRNFGGTNYLPKFYLDGSCKVGGDIRTLLGLNMKENYAHSLFENCDGLKDASKLILPFDTLSPDAYGYMFDKCSTLIAVPELPATNLASGCYTHMFSRCYSLEVAQEILPSKTLAPSSYHSMYWGCDSLIKTPKILATTVDESSCESMFADCENLTTSCELLAPTLAPLSYFGMFFKCRSLNTITMLATDISAYSCLGSWVSGLDGVGVSPTGTFTKKQGVVIPYGINGIPDNWTVIEIP